MMFLFVALAGTLCRTPAACPCKMESKYTPCWKSIYCDRPWPRTGSGTLSRTQIDWTSVGSSCLCWSLQSCSLCVVLTPTATSSASWLPGGIELFLCLVQLIQYPVVPLPCLVMSLVTGTSTPWRVSGTVAQPQLQHASAVCLACP